MEMRLAAAGSPPQVVSSGICAALRQRPEPSAPGRDIPDMQIALFGLGNGTARTHQV